MAQRGADAAEGAVERDVEHLRPLLVGHVDEVRGAAEPGVVHDDVEPTGRGDRPVEQGLHLLLDGDVARDRGDDRVAELLGGFTEPALVGVADDDPGALLEAATRRREADAGARRRR